MSSLTRSTFPFKPHSEGEPDLDRKPGPLPPHRERELAQLVNIGPFTARRLQSIGLRRPADLEALGAVAAYRSLAAAWPDDTTVFTLYALQGALMDLRWDALPDEVRADLWSSVA